MVDAPLSFWRLAKDTRKTILSIGEPTHSEIPSLAMNTVRISTIIMSPLDLAGLLENVSHIAS